jgi:hypothetical protein
MDDIQKNYKQNLRPPSKITLVKEFVTSVLV